MLADAPVRYELKGQRFPDLDGAVRAAERYAVPPVIMESLLDEDGQGRSWGRVFQVDADGRYEEVPQDYSPLG